MITSVHNPKVQLVRQLLTHSKARHEQGAFVIEGVRLAEEALQAGWEAQLVFFTNQLDARGKSVLDRLVAEGVSAEQVSEAVMEKISDTETPQGLLVVLAQKTLPLPPSLDFLLILDGIHDPGNLGTILRSAAAAGAQGVLLAPGCADAWSPKVVRAGMGAHFRLAILSLGWEEIESIVKQTARQVEIYLADSAQGLPYTQVDFRSPLAIIVGGEAFGAGDRAASLADAKVHISLPGKSESLNAAMAASILLFEVVRQRRGQKLEQVMLK